MNECHLSILYGSIRFWELRGSDLVWPVSCWKDSFFLAWECWFDQQGEGEFTETEFFRKSDPGLADWIRSEHGQTTVFYVWFWKGWLSACPGSQYVV